MLLTIQSKMGDQDMSSTRLNSAAVSIPDADEKRANGEGGGHERVRACSLNLVRSNSSPHSMGRKRSFFRTLSTIPGKILRVAPYRTKVY